MGIIAYILIHGVPYLSWQFLSTPYSETNVEQRGILPMIINTLYIVVITLLIATPDRNLFRDLSDPVRQAGPPGQGHPLYHEILSGIPSILFGLFGYTVFCIMFRLGTSILAGCLTMTICILPTIVRTTEESLLAVPGSYKEGAMALGAGKLRVILGIVLPCAMPGESSPPSSWPWAVSLENRRRCCIPPAWPTICPRSVFGQIMNSGRTLTLHLYQTAMQAVPPTTHSISPSPPPRCC